MRRGNIIQGKPNIKGQRGALLLLHRNEWARSCGIYGKWRQSFLLSRSLCGFPWLQSCRFCAHSCVLVLLASSKLLSNTKYYVCVHEIHINGFKQLSRRLCYEFVIQQKSMSIRAMQCHIILERKLHIMHCTISMLVCRRVRGRANIQQESGHTSSLATLFCFFISKVTYNLETNVVQCIKYIYP